MNERKLSGLMPPRNKSVTTDGRGSQSSALVSGDLGQNTRKSDVETPLRHKPGGIYQNRCKNAGNAPNKNYSTGLGPIESNDSKTRASHPTALAKQAGAGNPLSHSSIKKLPSADLDRVAEPKEEAVSGPKAEWAGKVEIDG